MEPVIDPDVNDDFLDDISLSPSDTASVNHQPNSTVGAALLTVFPPTDDIAFLQPETYFEIDRIKAWCGQFEICPLTQKLHAQLYVSFKHNRRLRFDAIRKQIKAATGTSGDVQVCKKLTVNARQCAINYALKPDTRHGLPFIWKGTCTFDDELYNKRPKPKKDKTQADRERIDWIESKPKNWTWDQIVHECDESKLLFASCSWGKSFHNGRMTTSARRTIKDVIIFYGAGGTGKTTMARDYDTRDCEDESERYFKRNHDDGVFWGGGRVAYHGQRIIHFEEFCGNETLSNIKEWCDVGKTGPPVNIKNGGTHLNHETVIFTSNVHPAGWYHQAWSKDSKQFHPFWRRVTKVLFFPETRPDGSLNIPCAENPPFYVDQTNTWMAWKGDFQACLHHASSVWPIADLDATTQDSRGIRVTSFPWP